MTTATVSVRDVSKSYGKTTVLDAVSFDLSPGITGLLGPNGAGKTTLLRIIGTVLPPDSGEVELLGYSARDADERKEIRRRLGYLPQELEFPRGFTAFGFIDYMAILKEWDDGTTRHEEVRKVLETVHLGGVATQKAKTLSGGMRRRLAISQALIGSPPLLLLDEPTTGLDPEQRVSLRSVLSSLSSTTFLSTHQTEDIEALCDRVIVLDKGRIRFDGAVTDLVATARGAVWISDEPDPRSLAHWRTGAGRYRHVGRDNSGIDLVDPTLEDAYLLMRDTELDTEVTK